MRLFGIWQKCIGLMVIALIPLEVVRAEQTMICLDIPGYDAPRYYKLESSFGESLYTTKLNGEWVEICSDSYMPLNKRMRNSADNGFYTIQSLGSQKRDNAFVCNVKSYIEPDDREPYTVFQQFIIDFELNRYQRRRNLTGDFRYQPDFTEEIITCMPR
jgi:hypothetical protein